MANTQANRETFVPVGIDLGTTYSAIAHLDSSGRPFCIPNSDGDILTPTAVLIEDGQIVVGKEAITGAMMCPQSFAECFKRDIGSNSYRRTFAGHDIPPSVLSAFVLERLKQDAELKLGSVRQVVLTVPAFFDETRRRATQEAGRLAGLDVLDIINEPTAAALAYGYQRDILQNTENDSAKSSKERFLVYDLGGGTFDVTILEVQGNKFRALATDGDVQLGGKDFDERLFNHIAELFLTKHGLDLRTDPADAIQLWNDVQELKHSLSQRLKASITVFHAGIRMRAEIRRDAFIELTQDLVERTETTVSLTLKQAGLDWSDIDRVLLVGGSSRMPQIVDMLKRFSGKEIDQSISLDEAVAHGAAIYASMLLGGESSTTKSKCELVNVNSHSLGVVGLDVQTRRRTNVVLIPKNTPLPARAAKLFRTARENQPNVKVDVVEGESYRPEECIALGHCVVRNLPGGLPAGTPIEVEYAYAANGRISVSARVPAARLSAQVDIIRDHIPEALDLHAWRARLTNQTEPMNSEMQSLDPSDPKSVMSHIDELYIGIGSAGMNQTHLKGLEKEQKRIRELQGFLSSAEEALRNAQQEQTHCATQAELITSASKLARARAELDKIQSQYQYALLALGRSCVDANLSISGLEQEFSQIDKLHRMLPNISES